MNEDLSRGERWIIENLRKHSDSVQIPRRRLCKICQVFKDDEETFAEITLDIVLQRRTWVEIMQVYNQKLPPGVPPITEININSHRRHTDPALVAMAFLHSKGQPVNEAELLKELFRQKLKKEIDQRLIHNEIFRQRISNVEAIQTRIEGLKEKLKSSTIDDRELRELDRLIVTADAIYGEIQKIVLRSKEIEKGTPNTLIQINQNFINNVEATLQTYAKEVADFLLLDVFKDDPDKGKQVALTLMQMLQKLVTPLLPKPQEVAQPVEYKEVTQIEQPSEIKNNN